LALNKLSQCLNSSQVKPLFQFFVTDALNDRNPDVRKCMLDAALATLNTHGKVGDLSQARRWGRRSQAPEEREEGWAGADGRLHHGAMARPGAGRPGWALAPQQILFVFPWGQKDPKKVLN